MAVSSFFSMHLSIGQRLFVSDNAISSIDVTHLQV
jgi:hypothetical protein